MDQDLESLKVRIASSDEDAFKVLFKSYRSRLFNYIFKITKSRESSEEIVMDVFLKLWEGRSLITEIENLSAFIFLVARNKSLDFLRKASKDKVLQELIWEEILVLSGETSDQKIIAHQLQETVDRAIGQLSPQRQSVYRLSREEHMSYDQIAAHLQLSKSTIKNHMLDALKFLRLHLAKHPDVLLLCAVLLKKYF